MARPGALDFLAIYSCVALTCGRHAATVRRTDPQSDRVPRACEEHCRRGQVLTDKMPPRPAPRQYCAATTVRDACTLKSLPVRNVRYFASLAGGGRVRSGRYAYEPVSLEDDDERELLSPRDGDGEWDSQRSPRDRGKGSAEDLQVRPSPSLDYKSGSAPKWSTRALSVLYVRAV